jgi:hypothetical protein
MSADLHNRSLSERAPRAGAMGIGRLSAWPRLLVGAAVAAIVVGALLLRVWTIHGSLPYVDHPDEPNPIDYVVRMLQTGDPNPHAFQKPSLYVYLLLAVLMVHYRLGLAAGQYADIATMPVTTHLYTTLPGFFVWGRLLTTALAAVTIACAYRLGGRLWNRPAGLIAALFLALSPFHMRHSQYVTTDVASGLLVLLAFGAAVAVARAGRWRDYLAAGAFAGLAASTKYNAGVAAIMVVAAHLIYWWSRPAGQRARPSTVPSPGREPRSRGTIRSERKGSAVPRSGRMTTAEANDPLAPNPRIGSRPWAPLRALPRLVAAGVAAIAGFVAGTPYAALSFGEFRQGLLGQVRDYSETAHGDFTGAWNLRGYLEFFWGEGLGALGCLAALAGLALLLRSRRGRSAGLIWLGFAAPYLLLHLAQTSHFTRNMIPLVVLSALSVGVAAAEAATRLRGGLRSNHLVHAGEHTFRVALGSRQSAVGSELHTANRILPTEPDAQFREPVPGARAPRFAWLSRQEQAQRPPINPWWPGGLVVKRLFFVLPIVVVVAIVLPSALATWRYLERQRRGDTRLQAIAWIDANIPPGERIAAELRPLPGPLESRWAQAPGLPEHDLAWYRRQGYAYLIASSDAWRQWAIPDAYRGLAGREPVAEFGGPEPRWMFGPHLAIYTTGLSEADAPKMPAGEVRLGGARLVGVAIGNPDASGLGVEPARSFKAGGAIGLRTFWSVAQPLDRDYFVFVHLVNGAGNRVAQRDTPPWQGRFPTSSWRAGSLVVDINDLALPAGLPPGTYMLRAGMFDPASGGHPPTSVDGRPADFVELGQITIEG